jgi:dolichol-phosphate mannosyltransferase
MNRSSVAWDVPKRVPGRRRVPLWSALATVLAAQVAVAAAVPLLPEEAYHWNYARHPDWSYFDHPPMIAWSIAVGRSVLGDTPLGVRLIPLLFALGTMWLLARMARQWYGESAAAWTVLLYALIPAAFLVGVWGFPDSPMLFFWALTLTWVWRALESCRPGWWLAAGAALGAGLLSKYTAAFLVPSVLLYLLRSPRDRRWLATPWPYLAGVCSLLVFAPVIYWNWTHDWASFRFQSVGRFQAANGLSVRAGLQSAAEQLLMFLPLTVPLAIVTVWRGATSGRPSDQFLFSAFAVTTAFFIPLGWTPSFHLLWPLPAYLALTVSMAGGIASRADRVAAWYQTRAGWLVACGACMAVVVGLHGACVLPGIPPLRESYGWDKVADRARALRDTMPDDTFYLAAGGRPYAPASQLAFRLGDPSQVYGANLIGMEALQYRYWANPAELAGNDAVVVAAGEDQFTNVEANLKRHFVRVDPVDHLLVPVGRFGSWPTPRPPWHFKLYRAYGYHPTPTVTSDRAH